MGGTKKNVPVSAPQPKFTGQHTIESLAQRRNSIESLNAQPVEPEIINIESEVETLTMTQAQEMIKSMDTQFSLWLASVKPEDLRGDARRNCVKFFKDALYLAQASVTAYVAYKAENAVVAKMQGIAGSFNRQRETFKQLKAVIEANPQPSGCAVQSPLSRTQHQVPKPSWASVAQTNLKPKRPMNVDHPVILIPKNKSQTAKSSKTAFVKVISPSALQELQVGITRVQEKDEGKIVVGMTNRDEAKKVIERLNKDEEFKNMYDIKEPTVRKPQVLIRGFAADTDLDTVLPVIYQQNAAQFPNYSSYEEFTLDISPIKSLKPNASGFCSIVFEISKTLRNQMIQIKKLKYIYSMISVHDYTEPNRCYHCCGLGHRGYGKDADGKPITLCKNLMRCSQCSGEHKYKDCPTKDDKGVSACCPLCTAENMKNTGKKGYKPLTVTHNALSNNCVVLQLYRMRDFNQVHNG